MISVRELLQQPFVLRALFVIVAISCVFPLYGTVVLIRRQANIAHTFAHMGLLGVAVAMWTGREINLVLIITMMLTVGVIWLLSRRQSDGHDATNEIVAQLGLVGAIIIASQLTGYRSDLSSYLFGDIVLVTSANMRQTLILSGLLGGVYRLCHRQRLQWSLDPLIARTRQSRSALFELLYLFALGLAIAGAIQVIGVLLVSAFLILPTNIARLYTTGLRQRQVRSTVTALLTSILALILALWRNIPTGAMIVACLLVVYGVSVVMRK